MKVVTDLSTRVTANEVRQRQSLFSSTTSPPTSLPTQRAMGQSASPTHPDVHEEVHRSVAERMRKVTAYTSATTEGDMSDD